MANAELTEQPYPMNFSDEFRLVADEKLLEEIKTSDDWFAREKAFYALQSLDDGATLARIFCDRIFDRKAVVTIVPSYHDWWSYDALLTALHTPKAPDLHLYFTSDHLFQILTLLDTYGVVVRDWPEPWLEWRAHDAAFRAQEEAKANAGAD